MLKCARFFVNRRIKLPDLLSFLSYLVNYKKNPRGVSLILKIISIFLFIYVSFYFIADFDFILNGKTLVKYNVQEFNCEKRTDFLSGKGQSPTFCNFRVTFRTPDKEKHISKTVKKYESNKKRKFMYIKDDPTKVESEITSNLFLITIILISLILFIIAYILSNKVSEEKLFEERLKKTGKYYKTKFIRIETKKGKILDSYSKLNIDEAGNTSIAIEQKALKIKNYWIITQLKIKGKENSILEFKSKAIQQYNPKDDLEIFMLNGEKIGVWVNPHHPDEYLMDLSFIRKN